MPTTTRATTPRRLAGPGCSVCARRRRALRVSSVIDLRTASPVMPKPCNPRATTSVPPRWGAWSSLLIVCYRAQIGGFFDFKKVKPGSKPCAGSKSYGMLSGQVIQVKTLRLAWANCEVCSAQVPMPVDTN